MSIKNTKNLIHDRSVVHNMGYHIVWAVKYRRKILTGEIESSLKEILTEISEDKGFEIKEMECGGVIHDRDINAAKNVENIGRDTAEFKPVEKLTTALSNKTTKQVGSMKQESLAF